MKKELKFSEVLEGIVDSIESASAIAKKLHKSGDIRAAGDEIEQLIREKISLFLPERYLVKQGHIINSKGQVSPQFDIIIFDRLNTPKFFESQNDTVYYPIESVIAVGEIKLTLQKNHLLEFAKKVEYLKINMKRQLIPNTGYGGHTSTSSFIDLANVPTNRKYRNPLFSFVFAVDGGGYEKLEYSENNSFMPNSIFILNYGSILYGEIVDLPPPSTRKTISPKLADEYPDWIDLITLEQPKIGVIAALFEQLIGQLKRTYIEPFGISNYIIQNEDEFAVDDSNIHTFKIIPDED